MKILLLGAQGQLGQCFSAVVGEFAGVQLQAYGRALDITQPGLVAAHLKAHPVDVVINCAAYTAVDQAEIEPDLADKINHQAVRELAQTVKLAGVFLVHFSTDYVFDGQATQPYSEQEGPNPLNQYGLTKLKGEQAMLAINPAGLLVRTSWLFSPFGHNFLTTMLKLGRRQKSVDVVADQVGSPTSALDLARAILHILTYRAQNQDNQAWYSTQLIHLANAGQASWAELAIEIMASAQLDCKVVPIQTAALGAKAKRPTYTVLDCTKASAWLTQPMVHWSQALRKTGLSSDGNAEV